jgi:hypothetical protein
VLEQEADETTGARRGSVYALCKVADDSLCGVRPPADGSFWRSNET